MAQATNLIIAEEGTPNASKGGWAKDADTIYNLFKKHLNNAKDCGEETGCFQQLNNIRYKALNNGGPSGNWDTNLSYRNLILADGVQVSFQEVFEACDQDNPDKNGSNQVCALINVDLNGEKKPNTIGRDVFEFVIKEKGLYPAGCDSDGCLGEGNFGRGYGCACKVLREGAMNY